MDDREAIRRLKNGDIGGLEELIARYQMKAVRTAYLVTHHEPMAEDVVQDVFIRFYERAHFFDERRAFEPYFLRSIVNAALNAIEKEKRMVVLNDDMQVPILEDLLAHAASVEEEIEYSQLKDEIMQLLQKLSPRQRVVVVLRYYLEVSEKDMAESLDVSPGTVKWLLNAARNRMRILLGLDGIVK